MALDILYNTEVIFLCDFKIEDELRNKNNLERKKYICKGK